MAWTLDEVDCAIDAYFSMLTLELTGERYSKAEFRRGLLGKIDRSAGSAEFKFQNISAVLVELGGVFIDGYKPARNVQQLLRERVAHRFEDASQLRQDMLRSVEAPVAGVAQELGEPREVPFVELESKFSRSARVGRHIDFQELEARNRALGLAGEEAVVLFERRRLRARGQEGLAAAVRHASVQDGDGLGYDVRSFRKNGEERFIEVKTTRFAREIPFHVSKNEVEFSSEEPERFSLYRLYAFGRPQFAHYELDGPLPKTANLTPESYLGLPRVRDA